MNTKSPAFPLLLLILAVVLILGATISLCVETYRLVFPKVRSLTIATIGYLSQTTVETGYYLTGNFEVDDTESDTLTFAATIDNLYSQMMVDTGKLMITMGGAIGRICE